MRAVLRIAVEIDPHSWAEANGCPLEEVDSNFRAFVSTGVITSIGLAKVTDVSVDFMIHTPEEVAEIQRARADVAEAVKAAKEAKALPGSRITPEIIDQAAANVTARMAIAAGTARPPRKTIREFIRGSHP